MPLIRQTLSPRLWAAVFLLLVLAFAAAPAHGSLPCVEGQVIVRFKAGTTIDEARGILDNAKFSVTQSLVPSLDIFLVKLKAPMGVPEALAELKTHPNLEWAQADHILSLRRTIPNDPQFNQQWDMDQATDVDIDAPEAWDLTRGGTTPGGAPIVVAVVDGGCQISHTDLSANLWVNSGEIPGNGLDDDGNGYTDDVNGWNAYNNNGTIPENGHGTHVSGTVGASGNNGLLVAGVNWNVRLMEVSASSGATSIISIGYNYVLNQKNRWWSSGGTQGANVVATNSSFGVDSANCATGDYPIWNNLYTALGQAGILNAVATANRNRNVDITGDVPAACSSPYIISVTNTTNTDDRNPGAAYGPINVDLGAPGTGILSTVPTNNSGFMSGTSMATPHVAGAIALMHAIASPTFVNYYQADHANATLTLKDLILNNVDPIPALQGITVSGGRLNLYNAVHAMRHYGVPTNDHCPGLTISSLPYSHSGTTATANNDYQNCVGWWSPEVVYTMLLPCSTSVTVSLCGSDYDTGLEVRTNGDCRGSSLVGCNDDYIGCSNTVNSQLSFEARPYQFYYIIVHGWGTSSGTYALNVTGVERTPLNDFCPGKSIASLPYSDEGSTVCATSEFNGKCVGASSPDVYYTLNLASCQTVTVSLCGSGYDTGLEVRAGGSCPGNTMVACDDDYCYVYGPGQVTFVAQTGANYYILIHGYGSAAGRYTMNVTGTPFADPNDHCPGQTITSLPFTGTGNTRCAVADNTNCRGYNPGDTFYSYTPSSCQTVTATLCGSGYDTILEIRKNGGCPGETVVTCNDDSTCGGSNSLQSTVVFTAYAGETYYVHVSGYSTDSGPYILYMDAVPYTPPNDACPGETVIGMPFTTSGSTVCATNDYTNCVTSTSPEVVYTMNLAVARTVTVSLCGSNFDTGLGVQTGGPCPGTTLVACNDDEFCYGGPSTQSTLTFNALANTNYYIFVHSWGEEVGTYTLNITAEYARPDSLVILPIAPRIYLYWKAVGGASTYSVYRDTIPEVQRVPANLIGTPTAPSFIDLTALGQPTMRYFYEVTAIIPQLIAGEGTTPLAEIMPSSKESSVVRAFPDELKIAPIPDIFIPAYWEFATKNGATAGK